MRLYELRCRLKQSVEAGIGWNGIGMAMSVALVVAAFVILCMMVRDVGIGKVITATIATPPRAVLAACCLVGVGYCTLTCYDYFALRALGRDDVPYATAALAGFAAYAIGHGIGLTLLTGNAVRLRIYSRWGLGVLEVAKISFITGLTFWLGNICALGFDLAIAPGTAAAVTHLPGWANQALGFAALTALAAYVVWLLPKPRAVGAASWQVVLPNARLTFLLIGIGIVELAAGSLATYVLLPAAPPANYAMIAVAYVIAALLGFVSHAPGSLGVFEVAMLVLLPQYQKEELLASLLILHVLYYVLPLAAALVIFGVRETRLTPTCAAPGRGSAFS
jgi:uncharacterized membrane protein YbhN (UPF0104 family)